MIMEPKDKGEFEKLDDNTFMFRFAFKNVSFERKFDNIDTLWRFIGELLKGEKV